MDAELATVGRIFFKVFSRVLVLFRSTTWYIVLRRNKCISAFFTGETYYQTVMTRGELHET